MANRNLSQPTVRTLNQPLGRDIIQPTSRSLATDRVISFPFTFPVLFDRSTKWLKTFAGRNLSG